MIENEYGRNEDEQKLFSRGLNALSKELGDIDAAAFIALVNRKDLTVQSTFAKINGKD
ncbi:MAG: hypothetical protein IJ862_04920 [Selenomonadaceae bacterium]|nr:hypothetical protein [Selenomonadaceae bacterium]